ncbi:hypothetical protein D3C84_1264040 [compost metagenome]
MSAMFANVIEGSQYTIMIANHGNRIAGDFCGGVGARLPNFFDMADPLPGFGEDLLLVQFVP